MPDERNRFIIAVGARTDRSVRTSLDRVNTQIGETNQTIREQQRQQRILNQELRTYGTTGRDGARDVRSELLRGTEAIEEQRRELDRLTQEGRELNTELRGTENSLGNVRGSLGQIAVGAAGLVATVGAAVGIVGGSAAEGQRIRQVADRAGIGTGQVQRLEAELTFAGVENPESAIEEFKEIAVRATDAAREEGEGFEGFSALGFDTRQIERFQQLAPEQQFRLLAEQLAAVTNESERFAISEQVLGGTLAEQVRGLIALDAAQQQVNRTRAERIPIISEEQIATLGELRSDLYETEASTRALRTSVATSLSPAVDVASGFLDSAAGSAAEFAAENQTLTGIVTGTGIAIGGAASAVTILGAVQPFAARGARILGISQIFQSGTAGTATGASGRLTTGLGFQATASGVAATAARGLGAAMTFALGPIGLIIIGIGLAIAVGILLYKNWDTVSYRVAQAFEFIRAGAAGPINFIIEGWNTVIGLGFKVVDAYIFVADKVVGIFNAIPGAPDIDIDAIKRIRQETESALTIDSRLDPTRREIQPPPGRAADQAVAAAPGTLPAGLPAGVPASALAGTTAMDVAPAVRELRGTIDELREEIRKSGGGGPPQVDVDQTNNFYGAQNPAELRALIDEKFEELGADIKAQA